MHFIIEPAVDLPEDDARLIPPQYRHYLIPGAEHRYSRTVFGHIFSQQLVEKDFAYEQHDFFSRVEGAVIQPVTDQPIIALHAMVIQGIRVFLDGHGEGTLEEGSLTLFYVPAGGQHRAWLPAGHSQSQHLNIRLCLVEELAQKYPSLQSLADHARLGLPVGVQSPPVRMDYAIRKVLEELHQCPEDPVERRLYIRARILTLLLFYVRDMGQSKHTGFTVEGALFRPEEEETLYRAQDILLSNEGPLLTIKELSVKIAMNTKKLKIGFKQLFGEPVYQFQNKRRIEKGAELLLSSVLPVEEIAELLHFQTKEGFLKAFKKQYGVVPSEYRKGRK